MTLSVHDEAAARLKVVTERDGSEDKVYSYQNHPNVNKPLFVSEGIVALKHADRAFPVAAVGGSVGVLRWRYTNKDDDVAQLPLSLTCLPEVGAGGTVNVIVEYALQKEAMSLQGVTVTLPLGGDVVPSVKSCDGSWKHNTREHTILWRIDSVSADNSCVRGRVGRREGFLSPPPFFLTSFLFLFHPPFFFPLAGRARSSFPSRAATPRPSSPSTSPSRAPTRCAPSTSRPSSPPTAPWATSRCASPPPRRSRWTSSRSSASKTEGERGDEKNQHGA